MESELAVIDVETSGLSPRGGGRVIEVAAVLVREGKVVGELESLLRVDCAIHPAAARVHGIGREMLCHAPEPEEVWRRFLSFVGQRPLVAHNAPFDMGFIRHELALLGLPLARHLLGGIPDDCRLHRALGDARLAARVWLAMNVP